MHNRSQGLKSFKDILSKPHNPQLSYMVYNAICEFPTVFEMKMLMSSENPYIIKFVETNLFHAFQKGNSTLNT